MPLSYVHARMGRPAGLAKAASAIIGLAPRDRPYRNPQKGQERLYCNTVSGHSPADL